MADHINLPGCLRDMIREFFLPRREDAMARAVELHKDIRRHTWYPQALNYPTVSGRLKYLNISRDGEMHNYNGTPCEHGCRSIDSRYFTSKYNDPSDERKECYRATHRVYYYP